MHKAIQVSRRTRILGRLQLTEEQKVAAASQGHRVLIEASPGSGKTSVAAERFGLLRFAEVVGTDRPIVAVSFTRSATGGLRNRVVQRWGAAACAWPNRIETIDALLRHLLEYLLRKRVLRWPGDHLELDVLDDWHGHAGFRPLNPGDWCRFMEVQPDGTVRTKAATLTDTRWGFSHVGNVNPLLESGKTTPREIRETLEDAFRHPAVRTSTRDYLHSTIGHLLVDEVFDANTLDLRILRAACLSEIPMTLIGDPWQAVYGWRGATPEQVAPFVHDHGFARAELTQSFRFETAQTEGLAMALRDGSPAEVHGVDGYEVALARKWQSLWELPASVLPISYGRPRNKTQAALALLLDLTTTRQLGREALFQREACLILGIEGQALEASGPAVLGPVLSMLGEGAAPAAALDRLRDAVVELGAAQRPPAIAASEGEHCSKLAQLATRLGEGDLVPGMTVFQAKGLEWDAVGVHLTPEDLEMLAGGLTNTVGSHRVLYVALTRARSRVGAIEA